MNDGSHGTELLIPYGRNHCEREREMAQSYFYKDVLPFSAMVAAECTNVILNILFKAATLKGLSNYVFNAYSFAVSTLVLLPAVFIF
ncbi:hypothetical protein CJ030_MR6G023252 [Morella rubra]|uniref:WAT1-related protein n=1 Tax=Morella rubra TaxID=262757 RepID=A0A6A1VG92_9ROSI|nr:hypothetical protein CJ030_MR6G023252 [Morella rubra]